MAREFVTVDANGKLASMTSKAREIHVAEVVRGGGIADVDVEGCEVRAGSRDADRSVTRDAYVPLFCCRAAHRPADRQPIEAMRTAAAKGKEGLAIGQTVMLNGEMVTL